MPLQYFPEQLFVAILIHEVIAYINIEVITWENIDFWGYCILDIIIVKMLPM